MVLKCLALYNNRNLIGGGIEMASFKCSDIGMKCGFEVKDENEEELLHIIGHHAEKTHGMETIPADMMEKIKKAIKPPVKDVPPGQYQHEEHTHH
jgi:predicted small metal-binding protein